MRTFILTVVMALGAGAVALSAARPAAAALKIDVTQGNIQPLPIAIPDFLPASPGEAEMARGITQIITGNLKRSGLFAPIDPAAFIEKAVSFDAPRFDDWRVINAQALVTGRLTRQGDGRFRVAGRGIELLIARHDLDNPEALNYLEGRLREIGVIAALQRAGFEPGDEVVVGEVEFELEPL